MSRGPADVHQFSVHPRPPQTFIAIGIPSFGMVHLFFMARVLNLRMPMNTVIRWFYVVGKEVGHARNEIVAKALEVETVSDPPMRCSHVFFLDDDVLFHPDALLKLLSHQRPIVSGLYYAKTSVPQPLVLHDEGEGLARSWMPGELVECAGHGMGLTLINADVFRALRDGLSADPHGFPAWFQTHRDTLIERTDVVGAVRNQTEDMHFLELARKAGYQPAVDTSPQTFGWHFDSKRMMGYPARQWAEFLETGSITWQTDHGPVTWRNVA